MHKSFKNIITGVLLLIAFNVTAFATPPKRSFYEIRIYTLTSKDQETRVENYLRDAYIPAMHRLGIKTIGVFKPVAADTAAYGKLLYVFTPFRSMDDLLTVPAALHKDAAYTAAGKDYIDAAYNSAPYARFESIVLQAFADAPMVTPSKLTNAKSERIYELRSYESQTEKIHQNKVKMFNAGGEITLFERLGFNAVFYGQVIAGSHMPNLMYLTTFSDKASRDEHWKAFGTAPEWLTLKADPEYQNNVSKNTSFFVYPTEYSDL